MANSNIDINDDFNISIHIDINMNIDIHIIINMNIEDYIIYYLYPIPYWLFPIGYSLLGVSPPPLVFALHCFVFNHLGIWGSRNQADARALKEPDPWHTRRSSPVALGYS